MDAHGHGIIHDIVLVGHRMKHLVDERLLRLGWDILKSKMIIGLFALG